MIRVRTFVVFAAFLVISGCMNSNAVGTSLNLGETPGMDCVPGNSGETRMFGDTLLIHEGNEAVTIKDISLVNADGVELTEAVLVKLAPDEPLVGFGEWPPVHMPEAPLPANWNDRIEAVNAEIEPGEEWNLVFALTSHSSDTASTEAVRIEYTDTTGITFEQETLTEYVMTSGRCEDVLK